MGAPADLSHIRRTFVRLLDGNLKDCLYSKPAIRVAHNTLSEVMLFSLALFAKGIRLYQLPKAGDDMTRWPALSWRNIIGIRGSLSLGSEKKPV